MHSITECSETMLCRVYQSATHRRARPNSVPNGFQPMADLAIQAPMFSSHGPRTPVLLDSDYFLVRRSYEACGSPCPWYKATS